MKKHDHSVRERFAFKKNTPFFREVRKGGLVTEICPYFRGQVVVSGGTANGTSQGEAAPAGFISRFQLDAISKGVYPGGTLKSLSPRSVLRRRIFDKGTFQGDFAQTRVQSQVSGLTGAAGTFKFNTRFPLEFALSGNVRPIETALNTDAYSGLQLEITTADEKAQFSAANDRVFDYAGAYLEIVDYREAVDTSDPKNAPAVLIEVDTPVPVQTTNQRMPLKSEIQYAEAFLDLLLITETTNGALTDNIINAVKLKSQNDQWFDLYSDEIKAEQDEYIIDPAESGTGLYYLPMTRDGLLMGAMREIEGILDVTNSAAADLITVCTRRVIFPQEFLTQQK